MTLNRIVTMVVNAVIRRLVNIAVDIGFRSAARFGRSASAGADIPKETPVQTDAPVDTADRVAVAETSRRARLTRRILRRIGR